MTLVCWRFPAMWYLIQGLIVFAVLASNVHWHWTPNSYLASLIAGGIALLFTVTVNQLTVLWSRKKRRT